MERWLSRPLLQCSPPCEMPLRAVPIGPSHWTGRLSLKRWPPQLCGKKRKFLWSKREHFHWCQYLISGSNLAQELSHIVLWFQCAIWSTKSQVSNLPEKGRESQLRQIGGVDGCMKHSGGLAVINLTTSLSNVIKKHFYFPWTRTEQMALNADLTGALKYLYRRLFGWESLFPWYSAFLSSVNAWHSKARLQPTPCPFMCQRDKDWLTAGLTSIKCS